MSTRSLRFLLLITLALLLSAPAYFAPAFFAPLAGRAQDHQPEEGLPSWLPVCNLGCGTISGSPLTIMVGKDASYQVFYSVAGSRYSQVYQPLFDEADAGLFVHYNSAVIGPDFWNHLTTAANSYDAWTSLQQGPVAGNGTASSPWSIKTEVQHPASGVKLTATTSYVNGSNSFRIDWETCLPQAGSVSTFLAADFYMQGGDRDPSQGFYDSDSRAVGVHNQNLTWLQTLVPGPSSPADSYFAGPPTSLWSAIGGAGAPGPGFNSTYSTSLTDTAAGLQWNRTTSACTQVSASWNVIGAGSGTPSQIFVPLLSR